MVRCKSQYEVSAYSTSNKQKYLPGRDAHRGHITSTIGSKTSSNDAIAVDDLLYRLIMQVNREIEQSAIETGNMERPMFSHIRKGEQRRTGITKVGNIPSRQDLVDTRDVGRK